MRHIEKAVLLQTLERFVARAPRKTLNIFARRSAFRGYAQRDPLNEYKNNSFQLF